MVAQRTQMSNVQKPVHVPPSLSPLRGVTAAAAGVHALITMHGWQAGAAGPSLLSCDVCA
jgi:hypothetical protein